MTEAERLATEVDKLSTEFAFTASGNPAENSYNSLMLEQAAALLRNQAEALDGAEYALVEAAIPLEAIIMAGAHRYGPDTQQGIENGVEAIRRAVSALNAFNGGK